MEEIIWDAEAEITRAARLAHGQITQSIRDIAAYKMTREHWRRMLRMVPPLGAGHHPKHHQ
jgi:hypothetical protein